jgi:IS6 family transposase
VAGHRFPRDIILLAVRYYLQLGAPAERIAGILADRGIDVSGRTNLRWVQKFGPALSEEIRQYRTPLSTTWLVDETYVKMLGKCHYLYRGFDQGGQVLDCWLSRTRDLAGTMAFFRRTIGPTGCTPDHVVTHNATFYPSAIRTCAPGAIRTAAGFYNLMISTNRCERNHGYVKSRIRPMRGLKSVACATRLFRALDAVQLVERDFVHVPPVGPSVVAGAAMSARATSPRSSIGWARPCRKLPDCYVRRRFNSYGRRIFLSLGSVRTVINPTSRSTMKR